MSSILPPGPDSKTSPPRELLHAAREQMTAVLAQKIAGPVTNLSYPGGVMDVRGHRAAVMAAELADALLPTVQALIAKGAAGAVDPAEIARQRELGWPDFHPEAFCHRCGGRNVYSWHAPNEVWNQVIADRWEGIVCPQCFTELALEAGIEPTVWKLVDGDKERPDAAAVKRVEELADEWDSQHVYGCCARNCLLPDQEHTHPDDPVQVRELLGIWSDNPPPLREHRMIPCPGECNCQVGPYIRDLRSAVARG